MPPSYLIAIPVVSFGVAAFIFAACIYVRTTNRLKDYLLQNYPAEWRKLLGLPAYYVIPSGGAGRLSGHILGGIPLGISDAIYARLLRTARFALALCGLLWIAGFIALGLLLSK